MYCQDETPENYIFLGFFTTGAQVRLEGGSKKEAILLLAAPVALTVAFLKGEASTALDVVVPSPAVAARVLPTVVVPPAVSARGTGSQGQLKGRSSFESLGDFPISLATPASRPQTLGLFVPSVLLTPMH